MHGYHTRVIAVQSAERLEGRLVVGGGGQVGEHLFAWGAEVGGDCGGDGAGVGDGRVGFVDWGAEDGGLVFYEAGDEGGGDVEGRGEDDADC